MECHSKAVGFISNQLNEVQNGRVMIERDRIFLLPVDIQNLLALGDCGQRLVDDLQAIERFRAEILAHVGHIEAGLSLGAEPAVTVSPYLQSAVYASLLPRLDMMKSLGLVWIPGVMAGMVVSGASPVYAGIYQFIVVAMILAASGITAGCGGGNYCPDAPLTRGQMAVFLSRALGLHWAP